MFDPKAFLSTVSQFAAHQCGMNSDALYLVALSGGADSVALLLSLKELGYKVEAIHCNFLLRGEESFRDENFCRTLCQKLSVEFHLVHFDTRQYAALHHQSIEMAARNLRYSYFERLRRDLEAAGICVAHHRDDNVETVLLNLIRGTGISGLTGMSPRNGYVLRPLLGLSRSDVLDYLRSQGQDYVVDSTNLETVFTRNAIRLKLLPMMETVNPSAREAISLTASHLSEAAKMLDAAVQSAVSRCFDGQSIDLRLLFAEASPEYVLFSVLKGYGFTPSQVSDIMSFLLRHVHSDASATTSQPAGGDFVTLPSGRSWRSATHQLATHGQRLLIDKIEKQQFKPLKVPEAGVYCLADGRKLRVSRRVVDGDFVVERSNNVASLDAAKVEFPLVLRLWEHGDRLVPFGMRGTKLVSDLLTDSKMPLPARQRQLVLADGSGRVVWVVGLRSDNRFRIAPDTRQALVVTIEQG